MANTTTALPTLETAVTSHGIDHPDYFPGHGTAFTDFDQCVTGVGDTEMEALKDAIDQLAMSAPFTLDHFATPAIDAALATADETHSASQQALIDNGIDREDDDAVQAFFDHAECGYYYVSIDWKEPAPMTDEERTALHDVLDEEFNWPAIRQRALAIRIQQGNVSPGGYGPRITENDLGYLDNAVGAAMAALPEGATVTPERVYTVMCALAEENGLMLGEQPNGTLYAFIPYGKED